MAEEPATDGDRNQRRNGPGEIRSRVFRCGEGDHPHDDVEEDQKGEEYPRGERQHASAPFNWSHTHKRIARTEPTDSVRGRDFCTVLSERPVSGERLLLEVGAVDLVLDRRDGADVG